MVVLLCIRISHRLSVDFNRNTEKRIKDRNDVAESAHRRSAGSTRCLKEELEAGRGMKLQ